MSAPAPPSTPPPTNGPSAPQLQLTPEQVKQMETNRLKAKAKQIEAERRAALANPNSSTNPSATGDGLTKRKGGALDDIQPAKRFASGYIEYDFSKMKDTKAGFMVDESEMPGAGGQTLQERLLEQQRRKTMHAPAPPIDPRSAPKCEACGKSTDLDPQFEEVFGVRVCYICKEAVPEKYSLLTKTECKEDYLLTDPELSDTSLLPHLLRPNPHKPMWSSMQLYLRSQIEAFANTKWGSLEKLDEEFQRRVERKKEAKDKKFEGKLRELRRKTRVETWKRKGGGLGGGGGKGGRHEHEWGQEAEKDGVVTRRCVECGMETEEIVF
ncbi:DNA repair protein [Saitoella complicata NRRL Y-17804]|nr:DNA repair protein [Saitoella complicata NRRL Y-17804]ODQ53104.1 DNA repair protein [Saitoella complicata NRRL Y-17804]